MRNDARQREIQYYRTSNGRQPFIEWSESIRDQSTQNRIDKRLERLEEYLVDGDLPFFLKGLRTFVESQGGVSELSKRTNIEPEIFLDVLSNGNAPRLDLLRTILNALECRLSIEP